MNKNQTWRRVLTLICVMAILVGIMVVGSVVAFAEETDAEASKSAFTVTHGFTTLEIGPADTLAEAIECSEIIAPLSIMNGSSPIATLNEDYTVVDGDLEVNCEYPFILVLNAKTLTVPEGKTLSVNGNVQIQGEGSIVGNVKVADAGKFTVANTVTASDLTVTNAAGQSLKANANGVYDTVVLTYEVGTYEELIAALANDGAHVVMTADITATATQATGYGKAGIVVGADDVLDGGNHKLTINGANATWDCAIAMTGGTVKNLTIAGAMRGVFMPGANGDVVIDNCEFKNVVYTFNSDAGSKDYTVTIKNTVLNGWTSFSNVHESVTFESCTFGEGSGYAFCRPYQATTFVDCDFAAGYELDNKNIPAADVLTFNDCTYAGEALSADNNAMFYNGGSVVIDGETTDVNHYVASVGTNKYLTLQAAIDAVQADETIVLLADVSYVNVAYATGKNTSINVPAGKNFTLDLNGHVISGENNTNGSFNLMTICSGASVIIDDTSAAKTGKITYKSTRTTANENHEGYTISNQGNLTLNGGIIENTTPLSTNGTEMCVTVAINNGASTGKAATFTMNGGVVKSNTYFAIRSNVYANNTVDADAVIVALNGGTVYGLHFCDWGTANLNYQVVIGDNAVVECGNYPDYLTQSLRLVNAAKETTVVSMEIAGEIKGDIYSAGTRAKIGNACYTKLAAAIAALKDGDTLVILSYTISDGTIKLPATLKNVTIKGSEGTVLKDMTISAADGNSYSYINLTFDGITFDNSRLVFTGWRTGEETIENLTITNCVFKNLDDTTNTAPVHINKDAPEAVNGFTFTNNVIDGATGGSKSGIYLQATGKVVIKDNVINNVSFRPYVVQITTDDGIADEFVVTGNTFSGSAVGRAQGLGSNAEGTDTVELVVSNNIFKGITDSQQICYWNFNAATTTADLSKNYYDIDVLANPSKIYFNSAAKDGKDLSNMGIFPIYTELNEDGTIDTDSETNVPAIMVTYKDGTVAYFSNILDAVPYKTNYDKLEGATIKLLSNYTGSGIRFVENDMILDLNGFTYTINEGTGSNTSRTQCFQIRNTANKVVIKNGTIAIANPEGMNAEWGKIAYVFNAYTNLVLENVTVDCTNLTWSYGASCYVAVLQNAGTTLELTGTTNVQNFNASVAGSAYSIKGAMTVGENVVLGGDIKLDAGATLTAPAGLAVATADGYIVVYNNGVYTSVKAVAEVNGVKYATVIEALQAAIDNGASELKILCDVREQMTVDFDLVIKADLTITADAPVKVEFYNVGTAYDFAVGSTNSNTLTIDENVHFDLTDRVIWIGYYGNNVDVVVNGYLGGYQIWHGADTTVSATGTLDSHGEAFIMRRNATLTVNGGEVNANYFHIYSGHIVAEDATITAGLVWIYNNHSYGSEGTVSFELDNTSFTSRGVVDVYAGEGKTAPITLTNGSVFTAAGKLTLGEGASVVADATSDFTAQNVSVFEATADGYKYTTLQAALNAGGEVVLLRDVTITSTLKVLEGKTVTLDLNGKTISGTHGSDYSMIHVLNGAELTIEGNGTISYAAGGNNTGAAIWVEGKLTLDGGIIEITGAWSFGFAVDVRPNAWGIAHTTGASFVMNGGTVKSTDTAVRVASNSSDAYAELGVTFTMNGGSIESTWDAIFVQHLYNGDLDINVLDGTVSGANSAMRIYGNAGSDIDMIVSGGNFTGAIKVADAYVDTDAIALSGGTYSVDVSEYCADGYKVKANADGTYAVIDDPTTLYIYNVADLIAFRDAVNSGANYFEGVTVYLMADIDLAGIEWTPIGSATKDHGFMGNFDGQNHKILNLTMTQLAVDSDGYAYAGFFGVTEGTDKNNQNFVKNLVFENVTINTTGHIVAAAIAYPYYTVVENITVCGDIAIKGGDYTAGVLAYTRRCVNASKLAVAGNANSYITGNQTVGGVISDIQVNGGLTASYSNFSVSGVTISGTKNVGGISGIICNQTLDGATVKNVTLVCSDARVGVVTGSLGGTSTIKNIVTENVTGATATVGACYDSGYLVVKNGDVYTAVKAVAEVNGVKYATLAEALAAAQDGDTIKLLADISSDRIYIAGKAITLDLAGHVLSGTCNASQSTLVYIENGAKLTVKDSVGNGKITYAQGSSNVGWTVDVKGEFVLESGTIELTGSWSIGYAVDVRPNSWGTEYTTGTKFVMNGGQIISSDGGVRVASSSATTHKNVSASFEMNGGLIDAAWDGVFVQQSDAIYDDLSVTINGGTIESDLNPIRVYGPAATGYVNDQDCMNVTLAGGTLTYTGTDTQTWVIEGILRVGGGSSVATIVENGDLVVSSAIAQNATAPADYKWVASANGNYRLEAKVYVAQIGDAKYESLADAFAAAQDGDTIKLLDNVATSESITNTKNVTLDLNGKTITGTDNATGSFGLITNKGTLTVTGNGTITLVATNNRGWSAYSSVISNTVGGKLVVESGTIEHLGGTDMAYAIDNLTNGKGTYAETVINGGTIKSTYRAIRMFLNGVEAQNILTVNGGTIEGANKSIWMQDPSTNANSGKLTVGAGAQLVGDVYLFVTAGSTQWPVEVSIAAAAFDENSTVVHGNVPGGYTVKNVNGTFTVDAGLFGSGTAEDPYMINNVADLLFFKASVNAGKTTYNAPGVWVALGADIDLAGAIWTEGIGDGHNYSFDGNFDGKGFSIKNLTITPYADESGYLCGGLFGYIYGNVTIQNLVLENITVKTTEAGHNVGALVGFANNNGGKANIYNITVDGLTIDAPNAYGVGAIVGYSYRSMGTISGCKVTNATITGYSFVGGITGYSNAGALISGCEVANATITATSNYAGGIAGLVLEGNVIKGYTLTDVTVTAEKCAAQVVGAIGSNNVTISGNVNAELIGGTYTGNTAIVAAVYDVDSASTTYFTTFEAAYAAAGAEDQIVLLKGIRGMALNLNSAIGIYFLVDKTAVQAGTTYTATIRDSEGNVLATIKSSEWTIYAKYDDAYAVYFDGISAKQMADVFSIEITSTDERVTFNTASSSVKSYVERGWNSFDADTKALLNAMLNYGAAAEGFFGYTGEDGTSNKFDTTLDGFNSEIKEPTTLGNANKPVDEYGFYATSSANANSAIEFNFKFNVAGIATMSKAVITYTDAKGVLHTVEVKYEDFYYEASTHRVVITLKDIDITSYKSDITCQIIGEDGTVLASATDSILNYCTRAINGNRGKNQVSYNFYNALVQYALAVEAYNASVATTNN